MAVEEDAVGAGTGIGSSQQHPKHPSLLLELEPSIRALFHTPP